MIYLDNSATTKPSAACVSAMTRLLCEHWGNPSSVHDLGIEAERELKSARKAVANALGAEPERVFFTSGGTEADNWAIVSGSESAAAISSPPPLNTTPCSILLKLWNPEASRSRTSSPTRKALSRSTR